MATSTKRSWKLQEFAAHESNVNCLALGHKSGRVIATGGDDKKVNLWAVGKHGCIMSLSGHTTPIECVKFNHTEELVCAGSQMGAMKVWDLEAAKLVKTLTGHRGGISCIEFHPYGDFVVSGSGDYTIKLWDARRKGCIFTFKGHSARVNSVKFSPDGQWVASSGEDTLIKVWDLRAGKTIHEFNKHTNSVTSVEFHPHEFLLASGGLDRTVNFWDLENFQLVSSEKDVGAVKCLWFNPDGECLFTGVTDGLKVLGWEPSRIFDSIPVGWGKVHDIATAQYQIVGASYHLTNVAIHIVDLKKVHPFGGPVLNPPPSPFSHGQSLRKSFSKEKPMGMRTKATIDVKTIEESTSGTDPEEDFSADITNVKNYTEIFKPNRSLARTPPPVEPFIAPESDADPTEPQILCAPENEFKPLSLKSMEIHSTPQSPTTPPQSLYAFHNIQNSPPKMSHSPPELLNSPPRSLTSAPDPIISTTPYSRSQSNLEHVFKSRTIKTETDLTINERNKPKTGSKYQMNKQISCKDVPEKLPRCNDNGIKHSASEANINNALNVNRGPSRKNSFSKPSRNSTVSNVSRIPNPVSNKLDLNIKYDNSRFDSLNYKFETPVSNKSNDIIIRPEPVRAFPVEIYTSTPPKPLIKQERPTMDRDKNNHVVPSDINSPLGLDLEEFLPPRLRSSNNSNRGDSLTEDEIFEKIIKDNDPTMAILSSREKTLRSVHQIFRSTDPKAAMERVKNMQELSLFHDVLKTLMVRKSFWSLDMCVITLPKILELIKSKYEAQILTGCESLKKILKGFAAVIKTNIQCPVGSFSVDIPREERYQKCRTCYDHLADISAYLSSRPVPSGETGRLLRELQQELGAFIDEQ